ncbi:MAG: methionine adenosyltransferase [Paludibacteraceae bacterium]|nr:methionine adenosyltransferase [Paludibacteraceae bacterium]
MYLFTSESVSEGHPDKVADQISDAILDEFLAQDPESKVACETFVTTGQVILGGEVKSRAYVDIQDTARRVINEIGYTRSEYMFDGDSCGILSAIHEQSPDINRGVERQDKWAQGAGDQGIIFGYACNETPDFMPLSLYMSHVLLYELAQIRKEGKLMPYLRPDAKSQVTIEYDDNNIAKRIHTIVVSTQHDEFDTDKAMSAKIRHDIGNILIPRVKENYPGLRKYFTGDFILHVNPTGKFVIGGPHGDTGLTGRKIIVDTYGGHASNGGGAFSGKDPSKVDRSAAYATRWIAKNLVAAGVADKLLVQVAYAIGIAEPVSLFVNTYGTSHVPMTDSQIADHVGELFDLRPYAIEQQLKLRNPIYSETAAYGHFGRTPRKTTKRFGNRYEGFKDVEVELFTWEKLDKIENIKKEFKI